MQCIEAFFMLKHFNAWPVDGGWLEQTEGFLGALPEMELQWQRRRKELSSKE